MDRQKSEFVPSGQYKCPVKGWILGVCRNFRGDEKGPEAMFLVSLYTSVQR
jgi:hypothetical protein